MLARRFPRRYMHTLYLLDSVSPLFQFQEVDDTAPSVSCSFTRLELRRFRVQDTVDHFDFDLPSVLVATLYKPPSLHDVKFKTSTVRLLLLI